MRRLLLAALLLASACGGADEDTREPASEARVEGDAGSVPPEVLTALRETIRRSDSVADAIEDRLRPAPLLRTAQENDLRRHPNATQVARARQLGARASDRAELQRLVDEGRLVALEDSTPHWVVRERASPAYVVPHTRALLVELGERFHERLDEVGLPPYRLEVTSALRTTDRQASLRRTNPNAAAGVSAHEFGTTVDLAWFSFPPPEELPDEVRIDAPGALRPHLDRIAALALESVSARKSPEMKAIFGGVLRDAQSEGLVMVTLERLQPVFHMTVAAPLADR